MNKDEYPTIPDVIHTEDDYTLILEYIVFSAIKIEELQTKVKNPFMPILEKRKQERVIEMALVKYDRMCALIENYRDRERRDHLGKMRIP
ncbi:hypothetical protein L3i20_v245650 [Paenibacillus sp. L3-i20]|nr:hypothetical protein L3i20_v245650 [Paenibacillus sp. L3-i20]